MRDSSARPRSFVLAVGADSPYKQELDLDIIDRAHTVVVDSRSQNASLGEIARGIAVGRFTAERMDHELGEVILRARKGDGTLPVPLGEPRVSSVAGNGVVICKLTGVATQDIFAADLIARRLGLPMYRTAGR